MRLDAAPLDELILGVLGRGGDLTSGQLARRLRKSDRGVFRALELLERSGRVARSGDGRRERPHTWALRH